MEHQIGKPLVKGLWSQYRNSPVVFILRVQFPWKAKVCLFFDQNFHFQQITTQISIATTDWLFINSICKKSDFSLFIEENIIRWRGKRHADAVFSEATGILLVFTVYFRWCLQNFYFCGEKASQKHALSWCAFSPTTPFRGGLFFQPRPFVVCFFSNHALS